FGQGVGDHRVAGGDGRQYLFLQFVGGGEQDGHGAELVDGGDQRGGGADAGDLLDHDDGGDGVGARPAEAFGDVHGVESGGGEGFECLDGEAFPFVAVGGVGGDGALGELADG